MGEEDTTGRLCYGQEVVRASQWPRRTSSQTLAKRRAKGRRTDLATLAASLVGRILYFFSASTSSPAPPPLEEEEGPLMRRRGTELAGEKGSDVVGGIERGDEGLKKKGDEAVGGSEATESMVVVRTRASSSSWPRAIRMMRASAPMVMGWRGAGRVGSYVDESFASWFTPGVDSKSSTRWTRPCRLG